MADALTEIQTAVRDGAWSCDADAVVWNFGVANVTKNQAAEAVLDATSAEETAPMTYRLTGGEIAVYVRWDGAEALIVRVE